ncbi:Mitochondrial ribosome-associated GTPase 1 [Exaiptasia diaphana]|nr:Mitochondrial ribosome-associated GTPase 1 [Exaiptasia diaphana]
MVPRAYGKRNPKFKDTLCGRPSVLILSKLDLTDSSQQKIIKRRLESHGTRAVFIDSKSQSSQTIKKIIPSVMEAIKDAEYEGSYTRKDPDAPYTLLVCGLPNVGKSSLINAMRRTYMKRATVNSTLADTLI